MRSRLARLSDFKAAEINRLFADMRLQAEAIVRRGAPDATLVEVSDSLVFYSYGVRGIEYTASQDLARFLGETAADFAGVSSMSVKYDPRNPANSIVVAEEWSGLRGVSRLLPENHPSR